MNDQIRIGWKDLLAFLSPAGQRQLVEFVRRAKAERGEGWLAEIQAEYPMFSFIADLVANYSAEDAFAELSAAYPTYPLWIAKPQLIQMHGVLAAEIDKPR